MKRALSLLLVVAMLLSMMTCMVAVSADPTGTFNVKLYSDNGTNEIASTIASATGSYITSGPDSASTITFTVANGYTLDVSGLNSADVVVTYTSEDTWALDDTANGPITKDNSTKTFCFNAGGSYIPASAVVNNVTVSPIECTYRYNYGEHHAVESVRNTRFEDFTNTSWFENSGTYDIVTEDGTISVRTEEGKTGNASFDTQAGYKFIGFKVYPYHDTEAAGYSATDVAYDPEDIVKGTAGDDELVLLDEVIDCTKLNGSIILVAQYDNEFNITYEVDSDKFTGEAPEAGTYAFGDSAQALAKIDEGIEAGYELKGWKIAETTNNWVKDTTYTEVPTGAYGDVTLTAVIAEKEYTITHDNSVTGADTIDFDGSTYPKYYVTTAVVLPDATKITPATGYYFEGWKASVPEGGDASEFNWDTDTLYAGEILAGKYGAVHFTAQYSGEYKINYAIINEKYKDNDTQVPSDTEKYTYNFNEETDLFSIAPSVGWTFKGWKVDATANGWDATSSYTKAPAAGYGEVNLSAEFEAVQYSYVYNYGAHAVAAIAKQVVVNTETWAYGDPVDADRTIEESLTLAELPTATAADGYTFVGWKITVKNGADTATLTPADGVKTEKAYKVNENGTAVESTENVAEFYFKAGEEIQLKDYITEKTYSDITITAMYTTDSYRVTYKTHKVLDNGTAEGQKTTDGEFVAYYTVEDGKFYNPVYEGMEFLGWTIANGSAGNWPSVGTTGIFAITDKGAGEYYYGDVVLEEADDTNWTPATYEITFSDNSWQTVNGKPATYVGELAKIVSKEDHEQDNTLIITEYEYTYADGLTSETGMPVADSNKVVEGWSLAGFIAQPVGDNGIDYGGWEKGKFYTAEDIMALLASKSAWGDVELVASWKNANYYTVNFFEADGTYLNQQSVQVDSAITEYVPTKAGYSFAGWYTEDALVNEWVMDKELTDNDVENNALNLYVKWEAKTYTVTYAGENYTIAPASFSFTYDDKGTNRKIGVNVNADTGYVLNGWTVTADDSTELGYNWPEALTLDQANAPQLFKKIGSVTLTPQWMYTVTFMTDGEQSSTQDVVDGEKATRPEDGTKTGYTFDGWYTDSSCDAKFAYDFETPVTKPITLYAKFDLVEYKVSYEVPEAKYDANTATFNYTVLTDSITLPALETDTEKVFEKWTVDNESWKISEEDGVWTAAKQNNNNLGAVEFTAVFTDKYFTVTFNYPSDGVETTTDINIIYGGNVKSAKLEEITDAVSKTGYSFDGWYLDGKVSKKFDIGNDIIADQTVVAIMVPDEYTVTFSANGGKNAPEAITLTYDQVGELPAQEPTRVGYTFLGWAETKGAKKAAYLASEELSADNLNCLYDSSLEKTLYAVWSLNVYNIEYHYGVGQTSSEPYEFDTTYTITDSEVRLPTMKKTVTNKIFIEWVVGEGEEYWADKIDETFKKFPTGAYGDVSLRAVYKQLYTVTYDLAKGTGSFESEEILQGKYNYTTPENVPTREGYTFAGWKINGTGDAYSAESVMTIAEDITLVATWTANPVVITYSSEYPVSGKTAESVECTFSYDDSAVLLDGVFSCDGYKVVAWTDGTDTYELGSSVTLKSDLALKAVWVKTTNVEVLDTNLYVTIDTFTVDAAYNAVLKANTGYTLPLGLKIYKNSKADANAVSADLYSYNYNTGALSIDKSVLTSSVNTIIIDAASCKTPNVSDEVLPVELELTNVEITSGAAFASCDGKADYALTMSAIGKDSLPDEITIELIMYKTSISKGEVVYTLEEGSKADYTFSKGVVTIDKEALEDLYEECYTKSGDYYEKGYSYALLISGEGTSAGYVNLVIDKSSKTSKLTENGISFDEALDLIDEYADDGATSATITLLGNVTTKNQIKIPEGFKLTIKGKYTITSTFTGTKKSTSSALSLKAKTSTIDAALFLDEDAELDLGDGVTIFYQADMAVYSEDEEADATGEYGSVLEVLNKKGNSIGSYLVSDASEAIELADELLSAKNTDADAVEITVNANETLTDSVAKKVGEDYTLILVEDVVLTAGKDLSKFIKTNASGMEVTVTETNGKYTYTVTEPKIEAPVEDEPVEQEPVEVPAAPETVKVTVTTSAGGSATPTSSEVTKGSKVSIAVLPDTGYTIGTVKINGTTFQSGVVENGVLSWIVSADTSIIITFAQAGFTDVTSQWFAPYVSDVVSRGMMVGYEDGTFRPYNNMTVAEYMTVMYRYVKDLAPNSVETKDTTGANWTAAAEYMNTILFGGNYKNISTTAITRYDVAHITSTVLQAVSQLTGKIYGNRAALTFTDLAASDPYYADVTYLSTVNIIDGYPDGSFKGTNNITRAEIAKVLSCLVALG